MGQQPSFFEVNLNSLDAATIPYGDWWNLMMSAPVRCVRDYSAEVSASERMP